jgi:hypothetical protein
VPQLSLTAKAVDGLKLAEAGQVDYWDTTLKGFGIRVSKTGISERETKTFFVRYRVGKRMRRLTAGDARRVTLADERTKARTMLVSVDNGDDPAVARAIARRAETFGEFLDEYLGRHARQNKRSWRDDERIAKAELLPSWRHRKATPTMRSARSGRRWIRRTRRGVTSSPPSTVFVS